MIQYQWGFFVMESQLPMAPTRCGGVEFRWGERTYIMGILNLSPDSFSGDGLDDIESAITRARQMADEGADIIDVGGESTRPGSQPVSADEESRRVIPVIERLAKELAVPISIDTYKSEVARRALEAGAKMLNDQWGLKKDPHLAELAAEWGVPLILMSNQRDTAEYGDLIFEIVSSLKESLETAVSFDVPWENIILDPGIGFGKSGAQNLEVIYRLAELRSLGRPILVGTSRKFMLDLPVDQRLEATAATVAIAIARGADMVRVHDVRQMVQVCRMSDAIMRRGQGVA
jgi:dihydropteroate synthase